MASSPSYVKVSDQYIENGSENDPSAAFGVLIEETCLEDCQYSVNKQQNCLGVSNWQSEHFDGSSKQQEVEGALKQLSIIFHLGWPNCIERFSGFLPGFMIILLYGYVGNDDEIAGAGLGFMFGNVTGLSIICGFALGLSPLCSQAYGAGNYKRCGDLLQRQLSIHLLLILPPVSFVWYNCEYILILLNQPPNIAQLCGKFLLWRLPALPFFCISEDIMAFIKSQRVFKPTMVIMTCLGIFTVGLAALLILPQGFDLGFIGGPIALTCSNILQTSILILMSKQLVSEQPDTWPSIWELRVALHGWKELLSISLPSALMMWGEWWAWETTVFMAGLLCSSREGVTTAAEESTSLSCIHMEVLTIISNTMMLAYYFHSGFSNAAASHIGNLLGFGDAAAAWMATRVCLVLVTSISCTITLILILFRFEWGKLFSNDPLVHEMVAHAILVVAAYLICDAIGPGALKNILISLGKVDTPAIITMVAFYVFGLPISVFVTFGPPHWMNIDGIWVGLLVGMACMVIGFSVVLYHVDFHATAAAARLRALGQLTCENQV